MTNDWVSVKDRLPDNMVSVLVYDVNVGDFQRVIEIAFLSDGIWNVYDGKYEPYGIVTVTHWMPLPELPEQL